MAINVLSYFTIQSHVVMVIALALAVVVGIRGQPEPQWLTVLRLLATTYVVVSGGVFALLILDQELSPFLLQAPLASRLLHFVLPIYAVGDFVFATHRRLPWSAAWLSLGFPILWAGYTLVRGNAANWYPYFFLDPSAAGGYGMISVYAFGLAVVILTLATALIATTRMRRGSP
ncbi:Pr6Pr family membrane protein [Mycetocola miduiensis]|uniref:Pr6Pr family membrane protein n=1 Tax=Mycetocola miduiensis TaxID=995034 RepID=UPI001160275B|nr:Pr6Pr family membrane protein [Mycetocola miduiensis]